MSPGDQLLTVFIDSVGVFISALISAFFGAFVVPIYEAIAAAIGISI